MSVVPDVVALIQRSMKSLRDSERHVAEVVLADLNFAMAASAAELAQRSNVSAASITRFCQALGFANLREFKLCVAQNLAISAHFMATSYTRTDSFGELLRSTVEGMRTALAEVEQELDVERLSEALSAIAAAQHVHILPLDTESAGSGLDLQNQLLALGRSCSFHRLPDERRMILAAAGKQALILLIRSTMPAQEDEETFEAIALNGQPSILISPPLAEGFAYRGVHLSVKPVIAPTFFQQPAWRHKQMLIASLLTMGASLNLTSDAEGNRIPLSQPGPPLKR